jgi:hypothetical protein
MPGRFRTASKPSSLSICAAPYCWLASTLGGVFSAGVSGSDMSCQSIGKIKEKSKIFQRKNSRFFGAF